MTKRKYGRRFMRVMAAAVAVMGLFIGCGPAAGREDVPPPTVILDQAAGDLLLGSHLFSCQWISWERFGRARVRAENGILYLSAEQRSEPEGDYAEVEGVILEIRTKSFLFKGRVTTRVSHINGGRPCTREGTMTFRVTGERKYWRLKEMNNPCDDVVDYIDIYFERPKSAESNAEPGR